MGGRRSACAGGKFRWCIVVFFPWDSETINVVVQSGETLYRIARQTLGQDSGKLIEQIQKLNPAVTDPDHIEAGHEIRLPRLSKPVKPPTTGGANDMSGKN